MSKRDKEGKIRRTAGKTGNKRVTGLKKGEKRCQILGMGEKFNNRVEYIYINIFIFIYFQ